ncbi:MAG: hypothetical protein HC764_19590 [Pleurocapsa sp. CRU_1_2]|nr:hypothetical protein [Pleurocapsa sp. CRU_1_2]
MYKFAPATRQESIIFGAERPKYTQKSIAQWIKFMQQQEISRVCCLLESKQLARYPLDLFHSLIPIASSTKFNLASSNI